ncbi:MAG: DinB family protein [Gemmatimonadota bacterium]
MDDLLPILERTPAVLDSLLRGLPAHFGDATEGAGTWSPFDVMGHLIHGERTDWIPRVEHILRHGDAVPFPPFDMAAHVDASQGRSLDDVLDDFRKLRAANLAHLAELHLTPVDLERPGRHPEFGPVTLGQHLATWAAHDLDHLLQVTRCLGRQFEDVVGPWRAYLRVVRPLDSGVIRPRSGIDAREDAKIRGLCEDGADEVASG